MAVSEAWCGAFGCSGWLNIPLGLRVGLEGLSMDWEGVKSGMLIPAFRAKTKKDKSNEWQGNITCKHNSLICRH